MMAKGQPALSGQWPAMTALSLGSWEQGKEDFAIVSDGVGGVGNTSHSTAREEEQNFQGLQRQ